MIAHFYRRDPGGRAIPASLPATIDLTIWRPLVDGLPSRGSRWMENLAWWTLACAGAFSNPRFAELSLAREGRQLHRLIVTPRWARFPFMAPDDLQIGGVWTAPDVRGEGLARAAIGEAHRRLGGETTGFWYVVDPANEASVRLAKACGYQLVGVGRRTRPGGLRLVGQFRMDRPCSDGA